MGHYFEQFDQAYLKWKAEQQTQDAKLKQQNSENYYLSKPNVNQHASAHTAATTSAQNFSGVTTTKISLNSATLAQLQQLKGVGAKKAQAIIDQVASVAENFLTVINDCDIEENLLNQVIYDIKANLNRMANQ